MLQSRLFSSVSQCAPISIQIPSYSLLVVLVEVLQTWVVHELAVEFLELLQRVLVVLTGALR